MAVFKVNEADNYGSSGGGGFFSIKNDKEVASVRFLYDNIDDVQGFAVHEIEIDGKKRAVNCLRNYGDPIDACPFCNCDDSKIKAVRVKYYIPLLDLRSNKVVIWERGKQFGNKLSLLCGRYAHLFQRVFDIQRNGKPGDKETQYEIFPTDDKDENLSLQDFDEVPNVLGTVVMDKSADEMQYFVDRGIFPDSGDNIPTRRSNQSEQYTRRTPATNSGSGQREVF